MAHRPEDAGSGDYEERRMELPIRPSSLRTGCDAEEVRIQFAVPGSHIRIEATGSVAWSRSDGIAGTQFTGMRTTHRETFRRWLSVAGEPSIIEVPKELPQYLPA